ncbi:MAG TPA: bacillithiol system redox-active protein YtxJ [Blastocatellia bacterium]|nr:bacillithiol system redox-active protein YtxJ [Blastocatellia bacterium]
MTERLTELQTLEELREALDSSSERPVLLFKHSLTCPISARALYEFKTYLENANPAVSYRLIVVQRARPVSDEVAKRLAVNHESPQALLVRNSREVWNASHFGITASTIATAIEAAMLRP